MAFLVVFEVVALGVLLARVGAAPTDVALSPNAGAVGTTVTVTGSACSPGLVVNPSRARVVGATLGVNADIAVPAGGAWSVQFVVPTNAIEGTHAIAAACVQDSMPVPYVPLTFTVTAAPASSTTLAPSTTTVTSTLVPLTTVLDGVGASTTTIAAAAAPPGSGASENERRSPDAAPGVAPPTTPASAASPEQLTSTATDPATASITQDPSAAIENVVAARVEHGGRQPLVFGALSPIGEGWLGFLVSILLVLLVMSGVFAVAWFRWLRHTRAREWWLRWMNQIAHIRSHARPPT